MLGTLLKTSGTCEGSFPVSGVGRFAACLLPIKEALQKKDLAQVAHSQLYVLHIGQFPKASGRLHCVWMGMAQDVSTFSNILEQWIGGLNDFVPLALVWV